MRACGTCGSSHNECSCLERAKELVRQIVDGCSAELLQAFAKMRRRFDDRTWGQLYADEFRERARTTHKGKAA